MDRQGNNRVFAAPLPHSRKQRFYPRRGLVQMLLAIYLLELVAAVAIVGLGLVTATLLQTPGWLSAPLWFFGYLAVYNLDRLHLDPADLLNYPVRASREAALRPVRLGVGLVSAAVLVVWPVWTGRFWLVGPVVAAAAFLQVYSRPCGTFRLKDIPGIKSLLPPTFIAAILVVWPALESGVAFSARTAAVFGWCWLVLAFNGLVFDYRDISGDRLAGTKTLAVRFGSRHTRWFLLGLSLLLVGWTIMLTAKHLVSSVMPIGVSVGCAFVLLAVYRACSPLRLSVSADLFLFVPSIVMVLVRSGTLRVQF